MIEGFSRYELFILLSRFFIEAIFLCVFAVFLSRKMGLKKVLSVFIVGRRFLILSFLTLWALVQLLDRFQYHYPQAYSFYPLERFAMYQYAKVADTFDTYQFIVTDSRGEVRELDITKILIDVGLPSVNTRFRRLSEFLLGDNKFKQELALRELDEYGKGLSSYLRSKKEEVGSIDFQILRYDLQSPQFSSEPLLVKTVRISGSDGY